MSRRIYGELCPVARSLDVVGERWTLLIVRELMLGPKRFKDLLRVLPAMGTNRLSARLKDLEAAGVIVRQVLPAPGEVRVYELTEYGDRLRPVVHALGAWGSELPFADGVDRSRARAELIALGLTATSPPELSAELDETYEFHIAEECFHVRAEHGTVSVRSGPARVAADLVVECDLATFFDLASGRMTPPRAARQGASMIGSSGAAARAFEILSYANAPRELRLVSA